MPKKIQQFKQDEVRAKNVGAAYDLEVRKHFFVNNDVYCDEQEILSGTRKRKRLASRVDVVV